MQHGLPFCVFEVNWSVSFIQVSGYVVEQYDAIGQPNLEQPQVKVKSKPQVQALLQMLLLELQILPSVQAVGIWTLLSATKTLDNI